MIDTDKYEGHTEGPWEIIEWEVPNPQWDVMLSCPEVGKFASIQGCNKWRPTEVDVELIADAPLLLAEVKRLREEVERMRVLKIVKENERLRSEPTVTVDDYHKEGHLYVTIRFPDEEEYVGLVEKWEGDEE